MGNYEFDGEKYKKFSAHQKELGNKIIGKLYIKDDSYALDLGGGNGVLTKNISRISALLKDVGFKYYEVFWVSQMQCGLYVIK